MIKIESDTIITLVTGVTDMRKNIAGLSIIAHNICKLAYQNNGIFVFRGRIAHKIKILWWDGNGFCLLCKSIDNGKFFWINSGLSPYCILSNEEFLGLMRGQIWENYSSKNPPQYPG
jgi:transposase